MANAYDLSVHDVMLQDVPRFTPSGAVEMTRRLTFYVGAHGPFIKTYPAEQATTDLIRSDIDAQVKQLHAIVTAPPES
jgi:hypothetical protein